jgi:hypothetical protein
MSLPPSYVGALNEEQHHFYRNVCVDLKKAIKSSQDCNLLREKMDRFLNASREVAWPHHTSETYRKDQAEKAMQKVANEFKRYVTDLENGTGANPQNLLEALSRIEGMIDILKVR